MELSRKVNPTASTTYAVAYAQLIVDHFSKALQENGCLIQVPVGLYIQFDDQYNRLVDYIESALNAGNIDNDGNGDKFDDVVSPNGAISPKYLAAIKSAIRKASNDCFACKIEKPKFDFSGIFGNLLKDITTSLDQFKNIGKFNKASVCQYAFFLSYLCLPDLLKLIALILAAIVKTTQNIQLPRLTVAVFINAILGAIIEALVKNISILARFALTPVLCILDSIDSIIDQLPTPENIRNTSAEDLKQLGVSNKFLDGQYDTNLKKKTQEIRKQYTSRVNKYAESAELNTRKYVEEIMGPLQETINRSVESLNNAISELTGLLNHYSCEPARSGLTITQYLSNLSELMAMANLLRYIVRMKSGKAAIEKICNAPSGQPNFGEDNDTSAIDGNLSIGNIGSVIADTIGSDIDLITDEKGNAIAVAIKDDSDGNKDNLSFYSCNLDDFARSVTVPGLIEEISKYDFPNIKIDEWNPSPWKVTIIPDSKYDYGRPNTSIIPLVINTDDPDWSIPKHIQNVIGFIDKYNGATDPARTSNEITFIDEDLNKIIKDRQIKTKDDNIVDGLTDSSVRIVNEDGSIKIVDSTGRIQTNNGAPTPTAVESVERLIANFSKSNDSNSPLGQLDCITDIENVLNKLGDQ
jgi:hypothetical protein|nr:MAG TPA: hypothetical protein [Bacteriophage sp.]